MWHPAANGCLDQAARLAGVVVVIAERVGDRFWHDDRSGEVDDRVDLMLGDDARRVQCRRCRRRPVSFRARPPFKAGRQAIEDDDLLARIDQFPDHVAADIAGAAGDQYRHVPPFRARAASDHFAARWMHPALRVQMKKVGQPTATAQRSRSRPCLSARPPRPA